MRDPYGDPTPAQRERAAELGITVPPGTNKLTVSEMIDSAPPSKRQRGLAEALGITITPDMTTGRLTPRLKAELERQGGLALRNNPALAKGKCIMHDGTVYVITNVGYGSRLSVSIRPITGGNARAVAAFTVRNAYEVDRQGRRK